MRRRAPIRLHGGLDAERRAARAEGLPLVHRRLPSLRRHRDQRVAACDRGHRPRLRREGGLDAPVRLHPASARRVHDRPRPRRHRRSARAAPRRVWRRAGERLLDRAPAQYGEPRDHGGAGGAPLRALAGRTQCGAGGGVTAAAFLGGVALVQGLFVALDLADRHATRDARSAGARLRPAALLFFLAVIAAFLVIQWAGLSLVPRVDALLEWIRVRAGGARPAAPSPHGWTLALASVALFYLVGLYDYAWHRWFSHHRWFWFTHENHHLPSQVFVGMPGLAARPFAVVSVIPVVAAAGATLYLALRWLGRPMWDWTVFQLPLLLSSAILTASHSSFLRRW